MPTLGVNVDHVATLRQARYREIPDALYVEPDPVEAALAAECGGADSITAHLRLDRRHMQERDIVRLREAISTKLNFEMGHSAEIIEIALQVKPEDACLVPEHRQEVTTEGGLDCLSHQGALEKTIHRLQAAGIRVSLFIDPEERQIMAAKALGAECVELHTGAFANAYEQAQEAELQRLIRGAQCAYALGLSVNAGHGINYRNVADILRVPHVQELNIGHSIISRAVFVGMETAVREMKAILHLSS